MADVKETVNSYITDMLALERHIERAIQTQVDDLKSERAAAADQLGQFHSLTESHISSLEGVATKRGADGGVGTAKKITSSLLGFAAGAIDFVRNEKFPKNLRDDYTAYNLGLISYLMLHTVGQSLGDAEIAALARKHFEDYSKVVMKLQNMVPEAVVANLREDGLPADSGSVAQVRETIDQVWASGAAR